MRLALLTLLASIALWLKKPVVNIMNNHQWLAFFFLVLIIGIMTVMSWGIK
jgi:hypothetical protein